MTREKRMFWILWACVSLASFLALLIGVKYILKSPVEPRNLAVYLVTALLFGAVDATLFLLRMKIAAATFFLGVAAGFFEMFRAFLSDLNGWQDLAGLMLLFLWIGVGLTAGILCEIIRYFFFKHQSKQ